ncbi:unnamed protein product [Arctia plantaginis]|uniref:Uncharacterized protein n=1 Tax=Arctia plantaginis TaxID=874455 RepID=A0A8S1B9K7_ARCPL|nr:unnamed protein product [Arctia plantaginis]
MSNVPIYIMLVKKISSIVMTVIAALVVLAKVTVAKLASFFFFVAFFQKLFYIGGILLNYFLKNQGPQQPPSSPQIMYGPPQEYNTVGYSYEPPDHEPFQSPELPSIADFSNGYVGHRCAIPAETAQKRLTYVQSSLLDIMRRMLLALARTLRTRDAHLRLDVHPDVPDALKNRSSPPAS